MKFKAWTKIHFDTASKSQSFKLQSEINFAKKFPHLETWKMCLKLLSLSCTHTHRGIKRVVGEWIEERVMMLTLLNCFFSLILFQTPPLPLQKDLCHKYAYMPSIFYYFSLVLRNYVSTHNIATTTMMSNCCCCCCCSSHLCFHLRTKKNSFSFSLYVNIHTHTLPSSRWK